MARAKDEKLERLARVELFGALNPKDLKAVGKITDQVEVAPGHVLCRQGDRAYDMYVIGEGTADVEIDGTHVASVGPGETVGEMALIDRQPRGATVTATSSMTLYVIDRQRFWTMLEDVPALCHGLLVEVTARLRKLEERPPWS